MLMCTPLETAAAETRVAVSPQTTARSVAHGHTVTARSDPGVSASAPGAGRAAACRKTQGGEVRQ